MAALLALLAPCVTRHSSDVSVNFGADPESDPTAPADSISASLLLV